MFWLVNVNFCYYYKWNENGSYNLEYTSDLLYFSIGISLALISFSNYKYLHHCHLDIFFNFFETFYRMVFKYFSGSLQNVFVNSQLDIDKHIAYIDTKLRLMLHKFKPLTEILQLKSFLILRNGIFLWGSVYEGVPKRNLIDVVVDEVFIVPRFTVMGV